MFSNKKWRAAAGILAVLFMTAAFTCGLSLKSSGWEGDAVAETSAYTSGDTAAFDTKPASEETAVKETETAVEATWRKPEEDAAASEDTSGSIASSEEVTVTAYEEFTASVKISAEGQERVLRLYRILLPVFLIPALAGLFVFSVFCKREDAPEGLETNLLFLGLSAGFLYMLFHQYDSRMPSYRVLSGGAAGYIPAVRAVDVLWSALLSCLLVWGIRTAAGWFINKRPLRFSLMWRLTEWLKTRENGVSYMLLAPFLCAVITLTLCVLFTVSARAMRQSVYGISGLMASLSMVSVLLFSLTVVIFLDRLREVRRVQEEMIQKARVNERYRVDLITNVSHDLRTPLTSIIGYGELLKDEKLSPDGRENLEKLNQKSSYLREMVDAVFELSKVQSGALSGTREQIDLIRLLEQTIGEYDDDITEAGLSVVRHYKVSEAPLLSDGIFLNQVFANLLSNAVKYTMWGTRIHVEVTDTGEGYQVRMMNVASYEMKFDEDEILERFARGDESRNSEGSGLGLAIAKTYTEAVGGSFRITLQGDLFTAIIEVPKEMPELKEK